MNFIPLYINYPSWIHPEIFPGVPVLGLIRWYGLMYIFAFGTAFLVLKKLLKESALDEISSDGTLRKATEDDIFSFIATGIIFLLIGARIFFNLSLRHFRNLLEKTMANFLAVQLFRTVYRTCRNELSRRLYRRLNRNDFLVQKKQTPDAKMD